MKITELGTLIVPSLEGKFLVVKTLSDGYTGTVQGNYNYEVVVQGEDVKIYPTTWNIETNSFVKEDEMVLYTEGDIIYYVARTQVDPYNHAVIEELIIEPNMKKENRILQAFTLFANDRFSVGNYNLFLEDVEYTNSPDFVPVDHVTLDKTNETIYTGDSIQITATIHPENATIKSLVFSVNVPPLAMFTVDGNVVTVTGLQTGTEVVTVTTTDGYKTAQCTLNIKEFIPVTGITLDTNAVTLEIDNSQKLVATVAPTNATTKTYTWSSDKPAVATVANDGTVTAISEGTANTTVTTTEGNKTATSIVTVTTPVVPEP